MFILQNNHKWAIFLLWGYVIHTFFLTESKLAILKAFFRVVKIYEPQLVNLRANNVQLDLQRGGMAVTKGVNGWEAYNHKHPYLSTYYLHDSPIFEDTPFLNVKVA